MILIVGILGAQAVRAFGIELTAVFAQFTGITHIGTAVAVVTAIFANDGAFAAMSAAGAGLIAGAAVIAVAAPKTGSTVHTDAAVLTEAITIAQFTVIATLGAEEDAVLAAHAAILTNDSTVAAHTAFFAPTVTICCAFITDTTVSTVAVAVTF